MPRHLKACERPLSEVLDSRRRFVIPPFQRPFAWTEAEARTLLTDILAAIDRAAAARDDDAPYFMGSIVLVKSAGEAAEQVVDGHQRLTTLTILLALLRDLDPETAAALDHHIRAPSRFNKAQAERLLTVRPLDTEFFQSAIQQPGGPLALTPDTPVDNDAQAKMLSVALAFREILEEAPVGSRRWLVEFLLRRCFVVEVIAPYQDQAFHIFTVMNARGKDLTSADLIKSEVLSALAPEDRNYYAQIWERLEADLGVAAFEELFGHIRTIHNPKRNNASIAADIRQTLKPASAPKAIIEQELEPKGRAFRALSQADLRVGAQSVEANALLTAMARIRFQDWMPPAIAYFATRRPRGDEALRFLKALDRMSYALFVNGADENTRTARYGAVIAAARDGGSLEAIEAAMALTPSEKNKMKNVLNGAIYQKAPIRAAVLLRIDESLSETVATYDTDKVTVEHILPQNPHEKSPWLEHWPDSKLRRQWTDRLGNLTLLSEDKNVAAANFPFEKKKREYFAKGGVTRFVLTSQILLEPEWTAEVVARRHKMMFDTACRLWDL